MTSQSDHKTIHIPVLYLNRFLKPYINHLLYTGHVLLNVSMCVILFLFFIFFYETMCVIFLLKNV